MNTHIVFKKLINSRLQEIIARMVIEIVDETRRSDFEKLVTKEELRSSLLDLNSKLKNEITAVSINLNKEIAAVRIELSETKSELSSKFNLLKWMVGISISMSITILAKLFFI